MKPKACPFCGTVPEKGPERLATDHWAVFCDVCMYYGPMGINEKMAVASWSCRPEEVKEAADVRS